MFLEGEGLVNSCNIEGGDVFGNRLYQKSLLMAGMVGLSGGREVRREPLRIGSGCSHGLKEKGKD